ncbi:ABC transporter substrate-binding protein [Ancylobacter amanitiformis]|uniref:Peptide/nickel transport system substrate-binding protein n=1 Tax=Ancylobacter amanitiformis TaxID=217069 RepID=A0ABU0LW05_9HYPH|nr:ABC transporter substrate-binding protein [Ancylobacter amanitiformis]MDQ0512901.1 peptide/nickel transport system substrate-binding protein [Ancylobacter amanitiformis]
MLTRRTLLTLTAASPILASEVFRTSAVMAGTPKGVVVMAKQIDDLVSGFDPAEAYEITNLEVVPNLYRGLVSPDLADNTKVVGDLAESWTVSEDGTIFVFKLKTDARFASGKAVTAEDAAFSFQRAIKLDKQPAFILAQFGYTKGNVDDLIKATDDTTLVMKLPTAVAPSFLLFCLTAPIGGVVEKATALAHEVDGDMGNGWLKVHSAGAGGYQMVEWVASDHVTLDANPHSGKPDQPRRIFIRHVPDPSAQLLMLQKGDADIARNLTPDLLKKARADKDLTVVSSGQAVSVYVTMNQSMPELQKTQVHQAIKWAIDYDGIAMNITPNMYSVAQGFLPPGLPGGMTDRLFKKDVAKAKQLLAEAGFANGFEVTMDVPSSAPYADIGQAVQADLADIGIKVTLVSGEMRQVMTKSRKRGHQLALLPWGTDYFDPYSNSQAFCENPDDSDDGKLRLMAWRSHYVDKELNDMSLAASKERDNTKRMAMYREMQLKFAERAPFAMLLQKIASAVMGKGVSGFVIGPQTGFTQYADIRKA